MFRTITLVLLLISHPAAGVTMLADDDFIGYAATGLSPGGTNGSLDSSLWTVTGASDGDTTFGDTRTGGDFARGSSPGGVGAGGLYAFLLPDARPALGVQATGSDFTPGRITRRVVNDTGNVISDLALALDLWYLNNGGRSTRTSMALATPGSPQWIPLPAFERDTPAAADGLGWLPWSITAPLPLPQFDPGDTLLLAWNFDDRAGSGSRDEIALSGLRVTGAAPVAALPLSAPSAPGLCLLGTGLLLLSHVGRRRHALRRG